MKEYFGHAPAVLAPRLVAALVVVIFARTLSQEEMGYYSLVILIGEYLDTVFCRWIRAGYSRFYFAYKAEGRSIDSAVLELIAPGLVLSVLFGFVYAGFDADLDLRWAALLALYVTGNLILYQGLQFLRVRGERNLYVLIEAGRSTIGLGLAILLTWALGPDYTWLVIGTQTLTLVAAGYLLARMLVEDRTGRLDRAFVREIIHFSGPLILSFFLAGTILVIDRVMLEKLTGPAMLGVYAVSYQLARPAIEVLFNIINVGGYPKLVAVYEAEGDEGARRVLYQKNVAIALVTFPVLFFILTTSTQIAELLLKDDYRAVAPLTLALVALSSFIRGWVRFLVDQIFLLKKTTQDQIKNLLPAAVATFVAAFVLIPHLGVYGAAGSAIIGGLVEAVFALWRARRRMVFRIFGPEIWIILAACVIGSVAILIMAQAFGRVGWLSSSAAVAILYAVAMKRFGIFRFLRA